MNPSEIQTLRDKWDSMNAEIVKETFFRVMEEKRSIKIGIYTISEFKGIGGGFWIEQEGGEGMQISEAKLSQWLHHFYEENF